jgi:hypothetical protein
MNDRRLSDAQIAAALRGHLPTQAQAGLQGRVTDAVEITPQRRSLPSIFGLVSDPDLVRGRTSLLMVAALLLALALATSAAVGAWQLAHQDTTPQLDLTAPTDVAAFVLSSYDRMPQLPPVAITMLEDGTAKDRIYVDQSGAVRFEYYATPDASQPAAFEILKGTTMGQLATVGSTKTWIEQAGRISEDPRVFLLAEMDGGGEGNDTGCGLTRTQGEVVAGAGASGWTYVGTEYVVGRPTFHVTCGGGDLWIDVETRLILRSEGPIQDPTVFPVDGQPLPGPSQGTETIEVTELEFGQQPADLFQIAKPAGVAQMSGDQYQCEIDPGPCASPPPGPPAYTPPPGAVQGPLPSQPPSRASDGWIAYSTDGQKPGGTDITHGSDLYLVREGGQPTLIAGRAGGTTRNSCPAFSPDGSRLAFGAAGPQGRAVIVLGIDASGVTNDRISIAVPGTGQAVCAQWSSDGTRIAYLAGSTVTVRGLDGSTPASVAGDPTAKDFGPATRSLLSPSGAWTARVESTADFCDLVVAKPNGTATHIFPLSYCPYAIAAWSPDGRQVLVMQDVSGQNFTMHAIAVDSPSVVTVVADVQTNGARSWPGLGDVSWQPLFP